MLAVEQVWLVVGAYWSFLTAFCYTLFLFFSCISLFVFCCILAWAARSKKGTYFCVVGGKMLALHSKKKAIFMRSPFHRAPSLAVIVCGKMPGNTKIVKIAGKYGNERKIAEKCLCNGLYSSLIRYLGKFLACFLYGKLMMHQFKKKMKE